MTRGRAQLPQFRITCLTNDEGFWQARVTVAGDTIHVDRRYGSWHAILRDGPRRRSFHRADVHPALAAELQRRVRPLEKKGTPA